VELESAALGQRIDFTRADGGAVQGYLALPAAGKDAPGVVVLHEWWGLDDNTTELADRLAIEGFRALAPDLYRGKRARQGDGAAAAKLSKALDLRSAAEDVRAAAKHLKAHADRKVAAIGFCMGGAVTLVSAVHVAELSAAVCFYGIPSASLADVSQIKVPLQTHFAETDDWCNPAAVAALEGKLKTGGVFYELHRYPAQHAFMNTHRPEVHDPAQAALAWERTVRFLKKTVS
jgi:carboxymethylenebutenolidase